MTIPPSPAWTVSQRATALVVAALVVLVAADDPPKGSKFDIPALIELHNKARAEAKLGPLTSNPKLEAAAKVQAKDQADRGKMDHAGSDGSTPAQRIERQGYRYQAAAENVATGQRSAKEVHEAWMNSPPHKANILGDFTEIGAACHEAEDGAPFWCVTFGRPWPEIEPEKVAPSLIEALNAARADAKLGPLKANPKLEAAATRHAREMAEAGKFLEKDSDGLAPTARVQKSGYAGSSIAQNDGMGQAEPAKAVKVWLDSEGSKKILLGDYDDVGVGVAADKDGVPYWSVLLGKSRGSDRGR